jgi:Cu+-exporting ATPase
MNVSSEVTERKTKCYHCGENCENSKVNINDKYFCCSGCKLVFEMLEANDMCMYYNLDENPGISQKEKGGAFKYSYLDDKSIASHIIDFTDGVQTSLTFFIPDMHCSSCVWLLENLYRLNKSITSSKVNFLRKELYEGGLANLTFTTPTGLESLYGQKKIIEAEGHIILRLAEFIKNAS